MSDHPKRTTSGQFAKGQSGNPAGAAARKPKSVASPLDISHMFLDVASRSTPLRTEKGVEYVSLLEWNMRALGSGTRVGTAPRAFIQLVTAAAWEVERHRKREEEEARIAARREAER